MIELFAFDVLQILINKIKRAEFFSVIMEKAADRHRTGVCFSVVTECLETGEFFLGFYQTTNTARDVLFELFKFAPLKLSLPFRNCRGLCHDGASNMSGI